MCEISGVGRERVCNKRRRVCVISGLEERVCNERKRVCVISGIGAENVGKQNWS